MQDFWRKDVKGLYALPGADGRPIKLIEASVAGADDRPASSYAVDLDDAPRKGYRYRAIPHADETVPGPARFAFCAFPSSYASSGRMTFLVDEGNTLFRKDLGHGRGVDVFPADLRKEGWQKLD